MKDKKQLIEEYFDATTSASRKKEIEFEFGELSVSDSDRVLLELGKAIQSADEVENLRNRMQAIDGSERNIRWLWLKVAASVLLFASITIILFNTVSDKQSNQSILEHYYMPYDGLVIARDHASEINVGIQAYLNADFKIAIGRLNEIDNPSGQLQLVMASCHLSLENWQQAVHILKQISEEEGQMIIDNRDWYLALAYLQVDEIEKSYELLTSLKGKNTPFAKEAGDLLAEPLFEKIKNNQQ